MFVRIAFISPANESAFGVCIWTQKYVFLESIHCMIWIHETWIIKMYWKSVGWKRPCMLSKYKIICWNAFNSHKFNYNLNNLQGNCLSSPSCWLPTVQRKSVTRFDALQISRANSFSAAEVYLTGFCHFEKQETHSPFLYQYTSITYEFQIQFPCGQTFQWESCTKSAAFFCLSENEALVPINRNHKERKILVLTRSKYGSLYV